MLLTRTCLLLVASAMAPVPCVADDRSDVVTLPQVQVVGTSLLRGSDVPLGKVPANVQILEGAELRRQRPATLGDFLERNANGVGVNAAQGNPFQADINFRGFSASPLLGTPQGISVFFDGVRVNEPFGDAVNWDLLPLSAISKIQLVPGSNPAYGLNTLGGAIAIQSKSGASEYPAEPGGAITFSAGSFGRRTTELETGGKKGAWDWFLGAEHSADNGWALHNQSQVSRLFAKLGWHDERTDVDLSFGAADNRLEGTQTLPASFADIRQPYTFPDLNQNRVSYLSLKTSHAASDSWRLSSTIYAREFQNRNHSSNVNGDANVVDAVPALNDASTVDQTSFGVAVQATHSGKLLRMAHKLSVGASVDRGRARFTRTSQPARFTPDRGTIGIGDAEPITDADSATHYLGAFATDSIDLDKRWTLTLSGRINRADVRITDRSGGDPALNGVHSFSRFNPAIGLNFNPQPGWTGYLSYNEGMRAPTAIELTCADPGAPCKLPNSFLADPPLKKVVSTTFELGARGKVDPDTNWNAALYRTDLHDDLQFVSSNGVTINAGYFQNVGTTRREGLELGGSRSFGWLAVVVQYSFIDATYRTNFTENSPNNSSADLNGSIQVRRGNRIPAIPRHTLKLRLEVEQAKHWNAAASVLLASGIQARGDENNLDVHGRIPGYAVVNLDARYWINSHMQLFARVDNLFDRRYANFGILGTNVFANSGRRFDPANARAEQFLGYGAPRGVWVGMRCEIE